MRVGVEHSLSLVLVGCRIYVSPTVVVRLSISDASKQSGWVDSRCSVGKHTSETASCVSSLRPMRRWVLVRDRNQPITTSRLLNMGNRRCMGTGHSLDSMLGRMDRALVVEHLRAEVSAGEGVAGIALHRHGLTLPDLHKEAACVGAVEGADRADRGCSRSCFRDSSWCCSHCPYM